MDTKNTFVVLTALVGGTLVHSGIEWICERLADRHIRLNCLVGDIDHKVSITAQKNDPKTWDTLGTRTETYPTFGDIPAYCEITRNEDQENGVSTEETVKVETVDGHTPVQFDQHLNVELNDCQRSRCVIISDRTSQKHALHCPTQLNITYEKNQQVILEGSYSKEFTSEFVATHVSNYPVERYKQTLTQQWSSRAFTGILTAAVLSSLGYFIGKTRT